MPAVNPVSGRTVSPAESEGTGTQSGPCIFLTGATGFIGRRLLQRLLDEKWTVRVLVRPGSRRNSDIDHRAVRIEGEFDDPAALARGLAGTAGVINCAGSVRGATAAAFDAANVSGVRALCEAIARLSRRPALLHLSSLAASRPDLSHYAASKAAGEKVLEEFPELDWSVFRPCAVYGPGDVELRATLAWARRGLVPVPGGNRAQRLSFLHVDDLVAAALVWLADPVRHRHRCYALDDGTPDGYDWAAIGAAVSQRKPLFVPVPASILRMIASVNERLATITGRPVMLSRGKVNELVHPRWVCDNTQFVETTGWHPKLPLARGVSALFES